MGGGEGNADSPLPPSPLVGPRRELQPLSAIPLSHPCHPQTQATPRLGARAVGGATTIPLHLPVDAIFSPSSSFSQRPSPSRVPPRRRTAQARNPQPRTLPQGRATGVRKEERAAALELFAPETVEPILSKEPDVTRGLRRHLSGQRASDPVSPTNQRDPLRTRLLACNGNSRWL